MTDPDSATLSLRRLARTETDRLVFHIRTAWFCLLTALLAVVIHCGPVGSAFSEEKSATSEAVKSSSQTGVTIGWNGAFFVGEWTSIIASFDVDPESVGECHLQMTASDPDGHRVVYRSTPVVLTQGHQQIQGFVKTGRPDGAIGVAVVATASGKRLLEWNGTPGATAQFPRPLSSGTRLVVTVGQPSGFSNADTKLTPTTRTSGGDSSKLSNPMHAVDVFEDRLPTKAIGWDGVSLLVLSGAKVVSSEQASAIREWLVTGGHLLISLPGDIASAQNVIKPFASWLPIQVGDAPVIVREFPKLVAYSGQTAGISLRERLAIPQVRVESAKILAGGRDDLQLARAPFGLGTVTVLSLDLNHPPLSQWAGIGSFARRLVTDVVPSDDVTSVKSNRTARLSSTGVTDLATQLHAIQDDFQGHASRPVSNTAAGQAKSAKSELKTDSAGAAPKLNGIFRASPWVVMGLMIMFLIIVGPLDYFLVHHVLKQPRATWITFPVWVALAAVLASQTAVAWNGRSVRVNQFQLLSIDSSTSTFRSNLWTNIYSPATTSLAELRASPALSGKPLTGEAAYSHRLSWSGVPETTFGGMFRPAGVEVGRTQYELVAHGSAAADRAVTTESTSLKSLPLLQWSTKSFVTETSGNVAGLIDSDLKSTGSGRLSGTLTHRLGASVEDWFVVYGNRVYRQLKQLDDTHPIPLGSKVVWRVEQPNVYQRELRPFLTGQITIARKKSGVAHNEVEQRLIDYDSLSLDHDNLARMLTFHDEAGGSNYTGLTNRVLMQEDFSHLLKLGRAVLFGRLSGSASEVSISTTSSAEAFPESKPLTPSRELTYIRLVLPVTVVAEAPRTLEKLDGDNLSTETNPARNP